MTTDKTAFHSKCFKKSIVKQTKLILDIVIWNSSTVDISLACPVVRNMTQRTRFLLSLSLYILSATVITLSLTTRERATSDRINDSCAAKTI